MKSGTSEGETTSVSLNFRPPATVNVNTVTLLEEENECSIIRKNQNERFPCFSAMSKTKHTAADIWLHSEYIYKRKWKCACKCVCFVHSYLRTFAARGRENCRTLAAFGITATLPPAGRQQVQPRLTLFFSCHFSPLTADIPSFSLHPLHSFLLCS